MGRLIASPSKVYFTSIQVAALFKWQHFHAEIILLNVRCYLRDGLSYRDLEEMMIERGVEVDHTTIYRWVQIVQS